MLPCNMGSDHPPEVIHGLSRLLGVLERPTLGHAHQLAVDLTGGGVLLPQGPDGFSILGVLLQTRVHILLFERGVKFDHGGANDVGCLLDRLERNLSARLQLRGRLLIHQKQAADRAVVRRQIFHRRHRQALSLHLTAVWLCPVL